MTKVWYDSPKVDSLLAAKVNNANFNEQVDDRVAALLKPGANVTITYDDPNNTLTIAAAGGGGGGGFGGTPIRVGKSGFITRSSNNTAVMGLTQGSEYAVGIPLMAGTYDRVGVTVGASSVTPGATIRIGFRLIDPVTGIPGPPLIDAAYSLNTGGDLFVVLGTPAVLVAGLYAMSWTRYGDTAGTGGLLIGPVEFNPSLVPMGSNTGPAATGHGPFHTILNTGIAGALPSTTVATDIGTNQEGNNVPAVNLRRSA